LKVYFIYWKKSIAIPATVVDVVPWWGFVLIFGFLGIIIVSLIVLYRQKRKVEYKVRIFFINSHFLFLI